MHHIPRPIWIILRFLVRLYWRLVRPLTVGVRGFVRNDAGEVLLVRHTYMPGWYLPGGGVSRGETMQTALARELEEEAGILLRGPARLFGLYANFREFKSDHVAMYVIEAGSYDSEPRRSAEIAEYGFYPVDALPEDTSPSTRRRIAEVLEARAPDELW